ncbi:MAG: hypothetical protein M1834_004659 [Cirrosporium novae-zelandiae]|nr:MAG: hypothetical protein M1834_004659 [Cirrosporium novae-zelandiae]
MALAPKFSGQKFMAADAAGAGAASPSPPVVHTLEIYLDYVCPYSAKLFKTLFTSVLPKISKKQSQNLSVIFRHQIQPWHPSSILAHESGVAVQRIASEKFWEYSAALFEHQTEYFDVNVVRESRNDTYRRLAMLAKESVGVSEEDIFGLLEVPDKPGDGGTLNVGNKVTDDLKFLIKAARAMSVHVSPTVFFDGVEEKSISSGWTAEQWEEWLQKNVI